MTRELFTFMGWTFPQWRWALRVHNEANPDAPTRKGVHEIPIDVVDNRLKQWEDLHAWYRVHYGADPPTGEVIYIPEPGEVRL